MKTTKQKKKTETETKLELQEPKVACNYYATVNMLNDLLAYYLKDGNTQQSRHYNTIFKKDFIC